MKKRKKKPVADLPSRPAGEQWIREHFRRPLSPPPPLDQSSEVNAPEDGWTDDSEPIRVVEHMKPTGKVTKVELTPGDDWVIADAVRVVHHMFPPPRPSA